MWWTVIGPWLLCVNQRGIFHIWVSNWDFWTNCNLTIVVFKLSLVLMDHLMWILLLSFVIRLLLLRFLIRLLFDLFIWILLWNTLILLMLTLWSNFLQGSWELHWLETRVACLVFIVAWANNWGKTRPKFLVFVVPVVLVVLLRLVWHWISLFRDRSSRGRNAVTSVNSIWVGRNSPYLT